MVMVVDVYPVYVRRRVCECALSAALYVVCVRESMCVNMCVCVSIRIICVCVTERVCVCVYESMCMYVKVRSLCV